MDRKKTGTDAERHAERFLNRNGMRTLLRNAYCRMGEIDLVMQEGDTIVFVEVRKRSHRAYGGAAQSVNYHKQRKLIQTARYLMLSHPHWGERPCRFDVVAYEAGPHTGEPVWYRDAFRP